MTVTHTTEELDAVLDLPGVSTYVDFTGLTQYRAEGPRGVFLITKGRREDVWMVWRPDSLKTASRGRNLPQSIEAARGFAGLRGEQ